jgi:lipooligosaccharide transport system permease protein
LIGVAFAGPMAAYAATRERDGAFVPVMRFGIVPMFLFSGTFFPISRLPVVLEWVARATPLWHGVDLCRGLTLGTITWSSAVVHVAYLLVWAVGGVALAFSTYRRRLLK